MGANNLPEVITKEVLLHAVQHRFMSCTQMFWNPNITVQQMYEDLSCSMFSGDPEFDFPEIIGPNKENIIKYQYDDGNCSFIVDGIEVEVLDLRSMRKSPRKDKETYADICILVISYVDGDMYIRHIVPDALLYGSTSDEFNEGKPVHLKFIDAAREYIKAHNITKEMQEVL